MKKTLISSKLIAQLFSFLLIFLFLLPMGVSRAQSIVEPGQILTPADLTVETVTNSHLRSVDPSARQAQTSGHSENILVQTGFSVGTTTVASVSSTGVLGFSYSQEASISANGRFVAFQSWSDNLVSGDYAQYLDIFVHDVLTGETNRVSVSNSGVEANADSTNPAISADGRYIAFQSKASNLVNGDTNNRADIFVHDRLTGTITRESVSSSGIQGNNNSGSPSMSGDGRYLVFWSTASNMVSGDANDKGDVFIRDRQSGETSRISVSSTGVGANDWSSNPSVNVDGRYVVFTSIANNLVDDDTNGFQDIFVHDRKNGETTRVSVSSNGVEGNKVSSSPVISADGRFIAFASASTNLVGEVSNYYQIFVHDHLTGETTRVSNSLTGGAANLGCDSPSISANGRYVAFESDASNLVVGDPYTGSLDIFVHDRQTGDITLVSVSSNGVMGNKKSTGPSISADGMKIAFESFSTNLDPTITDDNDEPDIYVHDRGGTYSIYGTIRSEESTDFTDTTMYIADEYGWLITSGKVNGAGGYNFIGAPAGTYLLVPRKISHLFTPEFLYVTVPPDAADQDFIVAPISHTPSNDEVLSTSKVTFRWNSVPGAIMYKLQLSTQPNFSTLLINIKVTENSYFYDAYLPNNTAFYWRVRPFYTNSKGDWLPTWNFTSMDALVKPTLTSPAHRSYVYIHDVLLEWSAVENAANYKVVVAKDSAFTNKVGTWKGSDLNHTFTLPDGKYYWRVRALDPYGAKGPWSDYRKFTVDAE